MDDRWLSTVRIARDLGDVSSLFPPGIERLTELPYTIHNAIIAALGFLTFDELPTHERPPKSIWLKSEAMGLWWSEVKRKRKAEMEGKDAPEQEQEMKKNALKERLLVGFGK